MTTSLIKYTQKELESILKDHADWLEDQTKGKRANLQYANLQSANLQSADLQSANLQYANLQSANLQSANFQHANLQSANFQHANLQCANLQSANLQSANLQYANLRYANLRYADLRYADLRFIPTGDSSTIFCMNSNMYGIVVTKGVIAIGCQQHSVEDWKSFTDERISEMDTGALAWWRIWKPIVLGYHSTLFNATGE